MPHHQAEILPKTSREPSTPTCFGRLVLGLTLLIFALFVASCKKAGPEVANVAPDIDAREIIVPDVPEYDLSPAEDDFTPAVPAAARLPLVAEPEEVPLPTRPIDTYVLDKLLPTSVQGFTFHRENSNTNLRPNVRILTTVADRIFLGQNNDFLIFKIRDAHKRPALISMANPLAIQSQPVNTNENETEAIFMWGDYLAYEKGVGDRYSRIQVLVEDRVLVELYGTKMSLKDLWSYMDYYDVPRIQDFVREELYHHQQEAIKARIADE